MFVASCMITSLLALALVAQDDVSERQKDRTGVAWVTPFTKAIEKAQKEKRLLMIKPIAFGTSKDGGW